MCGYFRIRFSHFMRKVTCFLDFINFISNKEYKNDKIILKYFKQLKGIFL